ncbi:pyridoxal phosphate-dependent aminotransferase [Gaiella sp.]|uniref:pyridoxal phosphate-dependent aminotransferase n=1 Tax=Gaiella sp. TaxID=2663207 RepID=UPI003264D460
MAVSRLEGVPGIGVDRMGDAADGAADPDLLRLENLDTDLRPLAAALEATRIAIDDDNANSYLPFPGHERLRHAVASHVGRGVREIDWQHTLITAGGLNGILNVLLATLEPGDEVVLTDPVYAGLLNRVRVAGGVPSLARLEPSAAGWSLDLDSLRAAVSARTRVLLMMSPSMPSGSVLDRPAWDAVTELCLERDLLLVVDTAMERILFDGRLAIDPLALDGMADRTIIVGSASKELRMIGWRVGWVVAPPALVHDIGLVCISNVVCQVGIAQTAVAVALEAGDGDVAAAAAEWERRRDVILAELDGLPVIPPHGGWSMLLDIRSLGHTAEEASERLFRLGRVAATPMTNWGSERAGDYVRFVFANEPCERLRGFGDRVRAALL